MIAETVKNESAMPCNSQDTSTHDAQAASEPVIILAQQPSTASLLMSSRKKQEMEKALKTNMGIK